MRNTNFRVITTFISLIALFTLKSYAANLSGQVISENEPLPYATIYLKGTKIATTADSDGNYLLKNIPEGTYTVVVKLVGYSTLSEEVKIQEGQSNSKVFSIKEDVLELESVVISGTRYEQDRVNNPVVVGVINDKLFNATQSIALSEGLNYQPGVRVETNCQNCGFTQVRLNGLEGGYSQILINNRPIFSALNSVYGLDQIPTNIVDRVEIVRSGGSALYGSNAIAGTINIITKDPVTNSWEVSSNSALVAGEAFDQTFKFNGSIVNEKLTSGVTFYGMSRKRDSYDANGDGFTELVKLENTVLGTKMFFKPGKNNKITLDFSALEEYRRGGDRLNLAPHLTDITEELDHNTYFGGINYDQWSKDNKSKFSIYASAQSTTRDSYYGGLGGGTTRADSNLALNSYGLTEDLALVGGFQYNRYFKNEDVITLGVEKQLYDTKDEIAGYNRLIDQKVNTTGIFAQYEWKPTEKFTALLGGRYDITDVNGKYSIADTNRRSNVNLGVFSPRTTLFYKFNDKLRFRGGYARGFRAPQAFNEDLHISSAGGEQIFVILSDDLQKETSDAFTASLNYTKEKDLKQFNLLFEGFHTILSNPFTQVRRGGTNIEEVVNGEGATVSGINLEVGYSPFSKFSFELGSTYQKSKYENDQEIFDENDTGGDPILVSEFVRAPNLYGYFSTFYKVNKAFKLDLTGTYTGSMVVPRVSGSNGSPDLFKSNPFLDANVKLSYTVDVSKSFTLEISGGARNVFNSYQSEFDSGPERDSDFIYGPAAPRSFFVSLKIGSLN